MSASRDEKSQSLYEEIIANYETLKSAYNTRLIKNIPIKRIEKIIKDFDKHPIELLTNELEEIKLMVKHIDHIQSIKKLISTYKKQIALLRDQVERLNELKDEFPVQSTNGQGLEYEENEALAAIYSNIKSLNKQSSVYFNNGFEDIIDIESNLNQSNYRNPKFLENLESKVKTLIENIPVTTETLSQFNDLYSIKSLRTNLADKIINDLFVLRNNYLILSSQIDKIENLNNDDSFLKIFTILKNNLKNYKKTYNQLCANIKNQDLNNQNLMTLSNLNNEILGVNNQVTITLAEVQSLQEIELRRQNKTGDEKKKLCDAYSKLKSTAIDFFSNIQPKIEKNAEKIQACFNLSHSLQNSVDINCLEEIVKFSLSEKKEVEVCVSDETVLEETDIPLPKKTIRISEKTELRNTLKVIVEVLIDFLEVLQKIENIFASIENEDRFIESRCEEIKAILEQNQELFQNVNEQIEKANAILEKQTQILGKAKVDLENAKKVLSNLVANFPTATIKKYEETIKSLKITHKSSFDGIKDSFYIYTESINYEIKKYQVAVENELQLNSESWISRILSWLADYIPCIKNTNRDALEAEKKDAERIASIHQNISTKIVTKIGNTDAQISGLKESRQFLSDYKTLFFNTSYNQLISDSNNLEAAIKKENAIAIEILKKMHIKKKMTQELDHLNKDLDEVNTLLSSNNTKHPTASKQINFPSKMQSKSFLRSCIDSAKAYLANSFFNPKRQSVSKIEQPIVQQDNAASNNGNSLSQANNKPALTGDVPKQTEPCIFDSAIDYIDRLFFSPVCPPKIATPVIEQRVEKQQKLDFYMK